MNIAINGFGRIGKTFLRTIMADTEAAKAINVVAINIGPADSEWVAHSFKYDSLMGTFPGSVHLHDNILAIDDHRIEIIAQPDPRTIDWRQRSIDVVVESSGHFTTREKASYHLEAGAKYVLITAPAKGDDVTIIPGINDALFDAHKHRIISLGSCTTNALIPLVKVLDEAFGIEQSAMTTVHAYTNTQVLLDIETDDPRRSRAAALNIIPSTTGVVKVLDKILPGMGSRFTGVSLRVPVAKVSIIDLVFTSTQQLSAQAINHELATAAQGALGNIMAFTTEPLVSSDFNQSPFSVVVDGLLTSAQGNMGKVFGWYDNEWGYSQRIKDFLLLTL